MFYMLIVVVSVIVRIYQNTWNSTHNKGDFTACKLYLNEPEVKQNVTVHFSILRRRRISWNFCFECMCILDCSKKMLFIPSIGVKEEKASHYLRTGQVLPVLGLDMSRSLCLITEMVRSPASREPFPGHSVTKPNASLLSEAIILSCCLFILYHLLQSVLIISIAVHWVCGLRGCNQIIALSFATIVPKNLPCGATSFSASEQLRKATERIYSLSL